MTLFFADFFFEGVERWQFWLGNPNKAAVFFAELVILGVWFILRRNTFLFWCGYILAIVSAFALLHTISRGGLLSCGIGVTLVLRRCRVCALLKRKRMLMVLPLVFLFMSAIHLKVHQRCMHGVVDEDASIGNRIILWSSAPAMFRAAPWGWGLGNAGEGYMKWFQPTDRQARYRTLVNSHLTLLVELGWGSGFLYLYCWCCALWSGWKMRKSIDYGLCIGEVICLFIGGIFSSVLESIWLWIVPTLSFCVSSRSFFSRKVLSGKEILFCGIFVFAVVCGLVVFPVSDALPVHKLNDGVRCGDGGPEICLFPDSDVLGGGFYPRELRDALRMHPGTINIVSNVHGISRTADLVVLSGNECNKIIDVRKFYPHKRVLLISPPFAMGEYLKQVSSRYTTRIWIGALSDSSFLDWGDCVTVFGGADQYIPEWAVQVLELADNWHGAGMQ